MGISRLIFDRQQSGINNGNVVEGENIGFRYFYFLSLSYSSLLGVVWRVKELIDLS